MREKEERKISIISYELEKSKSRSHLLHFLFYYFVLLSCQSFRGRVPVYAVYAQAYIDIWKLSSKNAIKRKNLDLGVNFWPF